MPVNAYDNIGEICFCRVVCVIEPIAIFFWDGIWDVITLRPRRNGHFADDILKRIFFNENVWISISISLKFVPKGPINNIPALVQIMAWCRSGDKPFSEPMMDSLFTHICVTRPQWVKSYYQYRKSHCGEQAAERTSSFHNVISHTGNIASLYIAPLGWYRRKTRVSISTDRKLKIELYGIYIGE